MTSIVRHIPSLSLIYQLPWSSQHCINLSSSTKNKDLYIFSIGALSWSWFCRHQYVPFIYILWYMQNSTSGYYSYTQPSFLSQHFQPDLFSIFKTFSRSSENCTSHLSKHHSEAIIKPCRIFCSTTKMIYKPLRNLFHLHLAPVPQKIWALQNNSLYPFCFVWTAIISIIM